MLSPTPPTCLQDYVANTSTMQYLRDHDLVTVWATFHACGAERLDGAPLSPGSRAAAAAAGPAPERGWWEQQSDEEEEEQEEQEEEEAGAAEEGDEGSEQVGRPRRVGARGSPWARCF